MTHLKIEQNTSGTEEVNVSVISKIYNIAHNNVLDQTSNLKGRLHSSSGYYDEIQYLNERFNELYISVDNQYIRFEDSLTEQLCITNFSTDGVGCTITDLNSVSDIGTTFKNNPVVNFEEFKYFTGITTVDQQFYNSTTLEKIIVPSTCTNIGGTGYAKGFGGCTALKTVTILGSPSLGTASFKNCSNLESVTLSNAVSFVNDSYSTFQGCSRLSSIDLTKFPKLVDGMFSDCTSLNSVTIPNNISFIGSAVFSNSGVTITFEQGGTTPLVLQGGTSGHRPGVFKAVPAQTIYFPERLSELKNNALASTTKINYVFATTTPPTVTGDLGELGDSVIYVPDSAVATYQSATGFSAYNTKIKSINEL